MSIEKTLSEYYLGSDPKKVAECEKRVAEAGGKTKIITDPEEAIEKFRSRLAREAVITSAYGEESGGSERAWRRVERADKEVENAMSIGGAVLKITYPIGTAQYGAIAQRKQNFDSADELN